MVTVGMYVLGLCSPTAPVSMGGSGVLDPVHLHPVELMVAWIYGARN